MKKKWTIDLAIISTFRDFIYFWLKSIKFDWTLYVRAARPSLPMYQKSHYWFKFTSCTEFLGMNLILGIHLQSKHFHILRLLLNLGMNIKSLIFYELSNVEALT